MTFAGAVTAGARPAARSRRALRAPRGWPLLLVACAALAVAGGTRANRSEVLGPPPARLLIADLRGRALVVVDTGDPSSPRRIPLPGGPHEMVSLPGGRVAVSLEQTGAIAVVDVVTGAVVRTLEVGGLPHGLALINHTLFVTDRATDRLRRFDTEDWREEASTPAGAWPHALAQMPGGGLAVANAADDTVNIGGHAVAVSHVPETIAVAHDGRVATAGSLGGAVQVFSRTGAPVSWHEVGGRPVRVLFSPDGSTLAIALSADGAVALIASDGVRRVDVGGVPDGLAFSPDGRWLYAGDDAGGIVTAIDVGRGATVSRLATGQSAGAILELPRDR